MFRVSVRIVIALVLHGFLIAGQANYALAQTVPQIAKKVFRSTLLLVMEDANGQPISLGSGFVVSNGNIATNLHVVQGATRGYAKIVGQKPKYNIEGTTAVDSKRDLVLLKISASGISPLSLADSDIVEIGSPVYAVGNPQGLEGTFSQGIVSGIRHVDNDKLLQITAPISPGSSGGPVLNSVGQVIGVSVATFKSGQNLNFAIPSNYLKDLIAKAGSVKSITHAASTHEQQSILGDFGDRSVEGVVGGQLIWDYPINQFMFGPYSFSIRNQLRTGITDVYCLVVFYDAHDDPIDVDIIQYDGVIPAGLAKRITSNVDGSVQKLTSPQQHQTPDTTVEIRILDFRLVE